jgi:hypothetical protein
MIEHMFESGDAATEAGAAPGTAAGPAPGQSATAWCQQIAAVSELEWTELDAPTTLELLKVLQRASHVVRGALAAGLATVDGSRVVEQASGLAASGWWATTMRGCGGEGTWLVRAGRLMDRFPELGAAVRAGEVPLEHLRALDGLTDPEVAAALAAMDGELCRRARRLGLAEWRRSMRRTVAEVRAHLEEQQRRADDAARGDRSDLAGDADDPDGDARCPDDPSTSDSTSDRLPAGGAPGPADHLGSDRDLDSSSPLELLGDEAATSAPPEHQLEDPEPGTGSLGWLSWRTTAEGSLLLRGELTGHTAEVLRQALVAETSRQRRIAWREHDTTDAPIPPAGELRAAALLELIRRGVAANTTTSAARTEAVIVIEADDATAERLRALDGEPLDAEVAALLTCDAHLQALVVGQRGQPLWLGRSTRLATTAQRRALTVRDGGCIFPGCEFPADWCDVHHQPGWEHGGGSDLHTMAMLCRRHHGLAHSGRWTLRPVPPDAPPSGSRAPDPDPPHSHPPHSHPPDSDLPEPHPPDSVPDGQRFEWHERRSGRVLPAAQRGLR